MDHPPPPTTPTALRRVEAALARWAETPLPWSLPEGRDRSTRFLDPRCYANMLGRAAFSLGVDASVRIATVVPCLCMDLCNGILLQDGNYMRDAVLVVPKTLVRVAVDVVGVAAAVAGSALVVVGGIVAALAYGGMRAATAALAGVGTCLGALYRA